MEFVPESERDSISESGKKYIEEMAKKMKESIASQNGKPRVWSLKDFEVGASLGRGKFGRVFLARFVHSKFKVAIKVLMKSEISKADVECQVFREIEIQSKLRHPNILQLFTYFHDPKKIYLVLEHAALGELFNHLRKAEKFQESTSAKFIYQVADALNYCHLNSVIHRDLKPENLLLTVDGEVKLSDFGWSVHAPSNRRKTMCGTIDYLPPEMVKHNEHNNFVDNWCVGILCYEFLNGITPFESKLQEETFKKIVLLDFVYPDEMPQGGRDLVSKLLHLNPQQRLPLPGVLNHFWIQKFKKFKVTPDENGYVK